MAAPTRLGARTGQVEIVRTILPSRSQMDTVSSTRSAARRVSWIRSRLKLQPALPVAQVHGGETVKGHLHGNGRCCLCMSLQRCKLLHGSRATVGAKLGLAAHPVSALAGNRALSELVFQLHLELGAVKAALVLRLCRGLGDVELTPLLLDGISYFVGHERWGGEDEFERLDRLQLALQGLKGTNRDAGFGDF